MISFSFSVSRYPELCVVLHTLLCLGMFYTPNAKKHQITDGVYEQ